MSDEQGDRVATARPLTRRELRERSNGVGDPAARGEPTPPVHQEPVGDAPPPAVPAGHRATASDRATDSHRATDEAAPDVLPPDGARYAVRHHLALVLIAAVLGFLLWSLSTADAEPGATGAAPVRSTTSPSGSPAATQGAP
jgi:hypothetical protein